MSRRHFFGSLQAVNRRFRPIAALVVLAGLLSGGLAAYYSGSPGDYVVQPGDSLWSIAIAHRTTVAELASLNQLDPNGLLLSGRHLRMPSSGGRVASTAGTGIGGGQGTTSATSFCSGTGTAAGPYGVLPATLASSPGRLALQPLFGEWAAHYGLSRALLEAVDWQESGWQQAAVSYTGAIGVGQIMPATGEFITNVLVGEPLDIYSVSDNIRMSAAFLAYLSGLEHGDQCATIAAYYEGPFNLASSGVFGPARSYVADVEALLPRFE